MIFRRLSPDTLAACAALHRRRRVLRARVQTLQACSDAEFFHQFPSVVAAVEAGFRHEEALLERLGDACLHPRRADHAIILSALHRTMSQVDSGDIQLGRQVADALGHVLELPCPFIAPVTLPRHTSGATHPRHALRQ